MRSGCDRALSSRTEPKQVPGTTFSAGAYELDPNERTGPVRQPRGCQGLRLAALAKLIEGTARVARPIATAIGSRSC
jgi:hypothetical protein